MALKTSVFIADSDGRFRPFWWHLPFAFCPLRSFLKKLQQPPGIQAYVELGFVIRACPIVVGRDHTLCLHFGHNRVELIQREHPGFPVALIPVHQFLTRCAAPAKSMEVHKLLRVTLEIHTLDREHAVEHIQEIGVNPVRSSAPAVPCIRRPRIYTLDQSHPVTEPVGSCK